METAGVEPASESSLIRTSTIIVGLFGLGVIRRVPCSYANRHAKGFGSFLIFYRFKATGGKVPCISRPGLGYAGLPEPTTALIKPQMRNYYCRFFFKGSVLLTQAPSTDGYPYFQDPRRNHYIPVESWLLYVINRDLRNRFLLVALKA